MAYEKRDKPWDEKDELTAQDFNRIETNCVHLNNNAGLAFSNTTVSLKGEAQCKLDLDNFSGQLYVQGEPFGGNVSNINSYANVLEPCNSTDERNEFFKRLNSNSYIFSAENNGAYPYYNNDDCCDRFLLEKNGRTEVHRAPYRGCRPRPDRILNWYTLSSGSTHYVYRQNDNYVYYSATKPANYTSTAGTRLRTTALKWFFMELQAGGGGGEGARGTNSAAGGGGGGNVFALVGLVDRDYMLTVVMSNDNGSAGIGNSGTPGGNGTGITVYLENRENSADKKVLATVSGGTGGGQSGREKGGQGGTVSVSSVQDGRISFNYYFSNSGGSGGNTGKNGGSVTVQKQSWNQQLCPEGRDRYIDKTSYGGGAGQYGGGGGASAMGMGGAGGAFTGSGVKGSGFGAGGGGGCYVWFDGKNGGEGSGARIRFMY